MTGELSDANFPPDPYAHLSDQVVMLTTEPEKVDTTADRADQVTKLKHASQTGERTAAHAQPESTQTTKKFDMIVKIKFESLKTGENYNRQDDSMAKLEFIVLPEDKNHEEEAR
jgi:hypothetical protein